MSVVARAAAVSVVASLAAAVAAVVLAGGFGEDDLGSFLFWTLPFAALVGAAAVALTRLVAGRSVAVFLLVAVPVAVVAAALWTIAVAVLLGPFFFAFSFPVLPCWAAGGAVGIAASLAKTRVLLAVAAFALLASTSSVPLLAALREDEATDMVVYFEPQVSDAEISSFWEAYLMVPRGSRGSDLLPGVASMVGDYEGNAIEIEFFPDATAKQKAVVRGRAEASPLVARVEERVPRIGEDGG